MNSHLLGLIRRSRSNALRRLGEAGRQLSTHHPTIHAPAIVDRIDDPDGRSVIVAVRGVLDASTLGHLWETVAQLANANSIHFDLNDTSIQSGPWMTELGILVDAVEDAGADVRVVGIDPHHPDLWHHS